MKISKTKWKAILGFTEYWNVTKTNIWTISGLKQVDGKFMTFPTFIPSHCPKEISEMMVGDFAWSGTNTECRSGHSWLWLSSETDSEPVPVLPLLYNFFFLTSSLNLLRAIGYIICYNWRMLGYIIYTVLWPHQHRAEGKNNFPESASPVYSLPYNNFTLLGPHSTWCLLYLNLASSKP